MKTAKQILCIAAVMLLGFTSKTAWGQGTLQTDDPSLVDPSDIFSAPPISQFPTFDLVMVTFDPSQSQSAPDGSVSPSALFSPSPVPEPSSLTLLTAGFFGAAIIRWLRIKRNSRPNQQTGDAVTGLR